MFGEIDPASRWVHGTMLPPRFFAGRKREAGDGEADQLALTAAEAADGIAHEENLREVVAAQCGAAERLAGAELASDGDAVDVGPIRGKGCGCARSEALFACGSFRNRS